MCLKMKSVIVYFNAKYESLWIYWYILSICVKIYGSFYFSKLQFMIWLNFEMNLNNFCIFSCLPISHTRLLSILESIPWNLFSLNAPLSAPAPNDCFVFTNSSALICAFVYRTSGLALGLVYFLNNFICLYLF